MSHTIQISLKFHFIFKLNKIDVSNLHEVLPWNLYSIPTLFAKYNWKFLLVLVVLTVLRGLYVALFSTSCFINIQSPEGSDSSFFTYKAQYYLAAERASGYNGGEITIVEKVARRLAGLLNCSSSVLLPGWIVKLRDNLT